jgi:uncharacterized protein (DUF169 family)
MNHLNLKSSLMKNDFSPPSRAKQYLGMACLFLLGFLQPYLSYAQTFNGTTGPIPDATQDPDEYAISSTVDFTANVTGLFGTIGTDYTITNVTINIEHTWVDDLDISLVGPDGTTTLNLSDDNGDNGFHYTNTVFTDAANINITAGFPPFAGSFNPEGPGTLASVFNGSAVNGIWTLRRQQDGDFRITDDLNFEEGTLLSWSITFQAVNPPVVLNCPSSTTTTACQTQSAVNNAFALWLLTASATGGCNGVLSNNNVAQGGAPPRCGGSRTVTFTYTSSCLPFTTTCQATFTVPTAPSVTLTCPADITTSPACRSQAEIDGVFSLWLASASGSGGCNGNLTNNSVSLGGAPPACGGSRTVTFIYTSACGTTTTTCQATCPTNSRCLRTWLAPERCRCPICFARLSPNQRPRLLAKRTQAAIDAKFAAWLATASGTGGCGGSFTNNATVAPPATGGSVTVMFTKTSTCAPLTSTCQASFTVSNVPPVVLTCPTNATASSVCLTQTQLTAEYNAWLATASGSGGCGGVLTNNSTGPPTICSATETVKTVTFTYTSTCEPFITTCQRTFTVPAYPDFNGPPNSGAVRVCLAQTEQPIPPVISDACGKPIIPTGPVVVDAPNPLTCEGTRTYTFTYTDCAGHSKDWSFVWTLNVPTLSVDAPGTATVPCPSFTPPTYPNTITDACGRPVTVTGPTVTSNPDPITCEGTKTYTWNLTDCAGNTNTWSWIITIERNDFTLPANGGSTVSCPADADVVPTPPSKMSECGEPIIPTGPVVTSTPACEGTKTYTWTYTDCAGHSHDWSYIYTIERQPFTGPANGAATVACPALATPPTPPTVMDNCGQTITLISGPSISDQPNPLTCGGTRTYTYSYNDCHGHQALWFFVYTIECNDFTVPANGSATVSCPALATPPTPPSVSEACGNALTPVLVVTDVPYPLACEGTRTYAYTYTDSEGNTATWSHVYTIEREPFTAPPASTASTVTCPALATAPIPPSVSDACGNVLTPVLSVTDVPYPLPCEGTRTYAYTYTDCEGNTAVWSHVYTIERQPFTAPPASTASTVTCPALATAPTPPSVSDACGNALTPVLVVTDMPYPLACEGTRTFAYTYTDCEGNTAEWSHVYTIERQPFTVAASSTASTVTCPALATAPTPPSVSDACGNALTPVLVVTDMPYPLACEGTRTFAYTYTDCEGNTATWSHVYTIERQPFTVAASSTASTVTCPALATAPTPPSVSDACGNALTPVLVVTDMPYPLACEGTRTFAYTYTDCEGNTAVWSHVYTIERNDFTVPANGSATVACPSAITTPTPPTVTSNCGEPITPTGPMVSATPACEGTKTYTWTYTDCEGNSHDWSFVYSIERAPFTVPANGSATVNALSLAIQPTPPVVLSNCGETITPTGPVVTNNPDPIVCTGTRTYTWTYTDCEGNTAVWSFVYTIVDSTPPVVTCSNSTVTFNGQESIVLNANTLVSATDNCGIQSITLSTSVITCLQVGQQVPVTATVTDLNGNTATCTSTVTVGGLPCGWSQQPNGVGCTDGNSFAFSSASSVYTATSTNCYYASPFTSDETAFAQRRLCGNGSITTLVSGINPLAGGWAGVVMRESNAAGAKKAQLLTNLSSQHRREFRTATNGQAIPQQFPSQNRYWLRITRVGNQFTMYTSANGIAWFVVGSQNIVMSSCIQVGLGSDQLT